MTPPGNFPKWKYLVATQVSQTSRNGMYRYWFLITDVGDFVLNWRGLDCAWVNECLVLKSSHNLPCCRWKRPTLSSCVLSKIDFVLWSWRCSKGVVAMITSRVKWRALTVMGFQTSDGLSASANSLKNLMKMCFERFRFHLKASVPWFEAENRLTIQSHLGNTFTEFPRNLKSVFAFSDRKTESGTLSRLENLILTVFITYVLRNFTSTESHYMFQVNLLISGNERKFNWSENV